MGKINANNSVEEILKWLIDFEIDRLVDGEGKGPKVTELKLLHAIRKEMNGNQEEVVANELMNRLCSSKHKVLRDPEVGEAIIEEIAAFIEESKRDASKKSKDLEEEDSLE